MSNGKSFCSWALSAAVAVGAPFSLACAAPSPAMASPFCQTIPAYGGLINICSGGGQPSSTPSAPAHYAAIYYDDATAAYGTSWGWGSEAAAKRAALDACRKRGGRNCQWATSGQYVCLALALGSDGSWAPSYADGAGAAMAKAVARCKTLGGVNCKVPANAHPCSED